MDKRRKDRGALGSLLHKTRVDAKKDIKDICKELPKTKPHSSALVCTWETGRRIPLAKHLPTIAAAYQLALSDVIVAHLTSQVVRATREAFEEVRAYLPTGFRLPPNLQKQYEEWAKKESAAE